MADRAAPSSSVCFNDPNVITLEPGVDLDGFRKAARWLIAAEVPPAEVLWSAEGAPLLLAGEAAGAAPPLTLPRPVTHSSKAWSAIVILSAMGCFTH